MGFIKDILLAGTAWKALKRSDRPGVIAPSNCTLLGMEHIGFGKRWKIIYCNNNKKHCHFNILEMREE